MKITFYGHASLGITIADIHIIVDPFISANPKASHIDINRLEADYILLTHAHQDHILDVEAIAKRTNAVIVSNAEIATYYGKKGFQSHCIIGNEAYGIKHPKKTPLTLLNNILGGPGMNSRLNLAVREKYGFTYSIESNYTPYSDTGIFSVYLASDRDKINRSIKLTKKELIKLCEKPLGTLQLKKAKQQLIGQIAIGQENDVNLMLSLGKSVLLYNKVDTFEIVKEKVEAVSSSQILEVANEIFNEDNLSHLIYKV